MEGPLLRDEAEYPDEEVISSIEEGRAARKIFEHLGLPSTPPTRSTALEPPALPFDGSPSWREVDLHAAMYRRAGL